MTANLYAACRTEADKGQSRELIIKRIRVTQDVQTAAVQLFDQQASEFMRRITEEVPFNGNWKPDANELLVTPAQEDAVKFVEAVQSGPISLAELDGGSIERENVRAIFTGTPERVLVQRFESRQILSRRFALLLSGDTFNKLSEPALALDTSLACIIESGQLKFKSFHYARQIFDLYDLYQEATDYDLDEFVQSDVFADDVPEDLNEIADQTCRKLISAIKRSRVLERHSVDEIASAAEQVGLAMNLADGKIALPGERKQLKRLLRFFDDGLYEAPLTGERYVTNSKRPDSPS